MEILHDLLVPAGWNNRGLLPSFGINHKLIGYDFHAAALHDSGHQFKFLRSMIAFASER